MYPPVWTTVFVLRRSLLLCICPPCSSSIHCLRLPYRAARPRAACPGTTPSCASCPSCLPTLPVHRAASPSLRLNVFAAVPLGRLYFCGQYILWPYRRFDEAMLSVLRSTKWSPGHSYLLISHHPRSEKSPSLTSAMATIRVTKKPNKKHCIHTPHPTYPTLFSPPHPLPVPLPLSRNTPYIAPSAQLSLPPALGVCAAASCVCFCSQFCRIWMYLDPPLCSPLPGCRCRAHHPPTPCQPFVCSCHRRISYLATRRSLPSIGPVIGGVIWIVVCMCELVWQNPSERPLSVWNRR